MREPLFLKKAQITVGDQVIVSDDSEFTWSFDDEGDLVNILTVKIPNTSKDMLVEIQAAKTLVFAFGYGDSIGTFITGSIISAVETYTGITKYLTIKAQQVDLKASGTFISKSYSPKTNASAVIKDLCRLAGFKVKRLELLVDTQYLTGTQRYGNVLSELKKIVTSCGSTLSISGNTISITNKNSVSNNSVMSLGFTSGLLNEPEKCIDKNKKYDYKIVAMASPEIENGTLLYINSVTLNTYVKVAEFSIQDFIGTYYVEVV